MDRFERVLLPLAERDFFREYWNQKPVVLRDASLAERFDDFPGLRELPGLLCGQLTEESWTPNKSPIATYVDDDGEVQAIGPVPVSMAGTLYSNGVSLCFGKVDDESEVLTELVEATRARMGHAGEISVGCYLTPPGSGGRVHCDFQHVFLCQVSGEKHWQYSLAPGVEFAHGTFNGDRLEDEAYRQSLSDAGVKTVPPSMCEMAGVALGPGDVLYLPPGTWHGQRTHDSHSLHYSLAIYQVGFWQLVVGALSRVMQRSPEWRRDLRFLEESGAAPSSGDFLAARLEELRQELADLTPDALLRKLR